MSEDRTTALPVVEQTGKTRPGNYFVSNYPPFSLWRPVHVDTLEAKLDEPGDPNRPLGLYVHIPFCRKRCHFCYFKVYTGKNKDDIRQYLDAVIAEQAAMARRAYIRGRALQFIYFGGGTPSFLSDRQLAYLFDGLQRELPWRDAEEVAFECEPGTLTANKLKAIRELGVTRLSLGIENFDDAILELNNRAHRSRQVYSAYEWAQDAGFAQVNIDLIAGMLGETEDNWRRNIDITLSLKPDAVTIYQMEVPFNTTIYRRMKTEGRLEAPVADWQTKRRWVSEAFDALASVGYAISSAYTAVRDPDRMRFVYRDALWSGADMLAVGVSSFGHLGGVHYQNEADLSPYLDAVEAGRSPVHRALPVTDEQMMIRQWVLQMKLGRVSRRPFLDKFGVDPFERWGGILHRYEQQGLVRFKGDELILSRAALLEVDGLLHAFFLPEHRDVRYA